MKKNKLNLLIDGVLLMLTGGLAGGGFLVYYILVPGREAKAIYGQYTELKFLGLNRFQWADIHLILCFIFLGMLLLHILLHWQMLINMMKACFKGIRNHKLWVYLFLFIAIVLMILPLFVKPELHHTAPGSRYSKTDEERKVYIQPSKKKETVEKNRIDKTTNNKPSEKFYNNHVPNEIDINGKHTLSEACQKYGVPCEKFCDALNLPYNLKHERLGRLRKQHNLQMTQIKNTLTKLKNKDK